MAWCCLGAPLVRADTGAMPPLPGFKPDPQAVDGSTSGGILVAARIPDQFRPQKPDDSAMFIVPLPTTKPAIPKGELFHVLSAEDASLYRRIFAAQAVADWRTADKLIARLSNRILMGQVLAQRYLHPTGWYSTYKELYDWLARYADEPDAARIYALAMRRRPAGAAAPRAPRASHLDWSASDGQTDLTPVDPSHSGFDWSGMSSSRRAELRQQVRDIRYDVSRGRFTIAAHRLHSHTFKQLADPLTFDRMAAEIAHGFFIAGMDDKALALASPALERSGSKVPMAGWIVGLASYRKGDLKAARRAFEILAAGPIDKDKVIAGAYWAARLNLITGRPDKVRPYLQIAASRPYTFYGLLASRTLGTRLSFDDHLPTLSDSELTKLASLPQVRRAVALVEAGQQHRADREFDSVSAGSQPALAVALLRLASDLGLPATQYRLGRELLSGFSERFDAALYPVPPWQPEKGFDVDPALLYAIMRRESGFCAFSRSDAGARGPMQIMPGTAAFISGDRGYLGAKRVLLNDPRIALGLAQHYVSYLLSNSEVDGNLFFLLAAYNGGPGNLEKWLKSNKDATRDPLLFLETIPVHETRFFVERVMTNYWMYRLRLGDTTPTLNMVASGRWPHYKDQEQVDFARN